MGKTVSNSYASSKCHVSGFVCQLCSLWSSGLQMKSCTSERDRRCRRTCSAFLIVVAAFFPVVTAAGTTRPAGFCSSFSRIPGTFSRCFSDVPLSLLLKVALV